MKPLLLVPLLAFGVAAGAQQASTGEPWRIVPMKQSSIVFARDGAYIGEIGPESRLPVSIRTLPKYVGEAFVAVEDKRFYQHDGVDLIGVAGAIKGKLLEPITGKNRGGASTITQLLIGNMHPDQIDRRDAGGLSGLDRKLREQQAAREMEKHYSKEQILEAFLNQINFGHGWYGIESASRHYFGKPATKLTLAEAATLAALPKSPVGYDPSRFREKSKQRRDLILAMMADQNFISATDAARAKSEPVATAPNAGAAAPSQYLLDAVRQELDRAAFNYAAGGFRIYTTEDPALQRAAVDALVEGTASVERRADFRHPTWASAKGKGDLLEGIVVAVDPFSGDVRALVGGRNYSMAPFNRAIRATRQPGSSFKPFVYAKALEDGMSAASIVYDTALAIPMPNGDTYSPDNADNKFLGPLTMREALIHSRNPVAVQLALFEGLDSMAAIAHRAGISTPIAAVPASAIGASVVRPLDYVTAYSVWANLGSAVQPRIVTRVEDSNGRVLFQQSAAPPQQVIDPRVAFIIRDMMKEAATRGTGAPARKAVQSQIDIAGKTGTTNDNVDVWFMGMTPDLVAGVWLGFDRPKTITAGAVGGTLAAPIWGQMMSRYYAGRSAPPAWVPPAGLVTAELDRTTGQLATAATPLEKRYTEYFVPGTEPEPLRSIPWKTGVFGALVP